MSILSNITGAVSTVTGFSTRTKVEIGMCAVIIAAAFAGWMWVQNLLDSRTDQAQQITTLTTSNATLKQEKLQLQTDKASAEAQRDTYAVRAENLNQENKANEQKAQQYQSDSEKTRAELAALQNGDVCATHPVPGGVIRMQQQAISDFNAGYSG